MRLRVKGKNIEVDAPLHEYAETKLGKLEKHLLGDPEVEVELSEEKNPASPRLTCGSRSTACTRTSSGRRGATARSGAKSRAGAASTTTPRSS